MVFKTLIRKETEAMLFIIMVGGRLFFCLSLHLSDIGDMNQNLSKGFIIRLKVKTLILRHSFGKKINSTLTLAQISYTFKIQKEMFSILEFNSFYNHFFSKSNYLKDFSQVISMTEKQYFFYLREHLADRRIRVSI